MIKNKDRLASASTNTEKLLNDIKTGKTHIYTIRPTSSYSSLLKSARRNNFASQNMLSTFRSESGHIDSASKLQDNYITTDNQGKYRESLQKNKFMPVYAMASNIDPENTTSTYNQNQTKEKSQYKNNQYQIEKLNTFQSKNTMSDYRLNRPLTSQLVSPNNNKRMKKSSSNIKSLKYINPNTKPIGFTGNDLSTIKTTKPSANELATTETSQTNFFTNTENSKLTFKFSTNSMKEKLYNQYTKMLNDGTLQKVTENVNKYYPDKNFTNFEDLQTSFDYIDILNTTIKNVEEGEFVIHGDHVCEIEPNKTYDLEIQPKSYFFFKIKVKNMISPIKLVFKKICVYNSNYEIFYSFQNERPTYQTEYRKKLINPTSLEIKCRFKEEKFKDSYLCFSYFSDTTMTIKTNAHFSKKQKLVFRKEESAEMKIFTQGDKHLKDTADTFFGHLLDFERKNVFEGLRVQCYMKGNVSGKNYVEENIKGAFKDLTMTQEQIETRAKEFDRRLQQAKDINKNHISSYNKMNAYNKDKKEIKEKLEKKL